MFKAIVFFIGQLLYSSCFAIVVPNKKNRAAVFTIVKTTVF